MSDIQDAPAYGYCEECGGEVYAEELVYDIEGQIICEECIGWFAKKYFSADRVKGEEIKGGKYI